MVIGVNTNKGATAVSNEQQASPQEVLSQVREAWQTFWSAASDLSDEELIRPGVAGDWAGKDVLLHVGRWVETGAAEIQRHLAGQPAGDDYSDYLAWNDRWAAADQDIAAGAARTRCNAAYATLTGILTPLTVEQWDATVREWVENTTSGHFQEHADQLAAWRAAHPSGAVSPTA
jgi:hypothetical protein